MWYKVNINRKRKNLIGLGVEKDQSYAWSRSRIGGWAIVKSPILGATITLEQLNKRGYISLLGIYKQIYSYCRENLFPTI